MAIQGLRTTTNFATDERPKNWREGILYLYPNGKAPLTALTAQMKSRTVDDPEFNWWEKVLQSRRIQLAGSITAVTTQWTVAAASGGQGGAKQVKLGDVLLNLATSEKVIVEADPTSDTVLTVSRGQGGTTATLITITTAGQDNWFYIIGNVNQEGSEAPTGVNYDPTKVYNYTQIFRDTFEATNTALKTRLRTVAAAKEAKRECLETHSNGLEKAFFFGSRLETTRSGNPARMTGGLTQYIPAANTFIWGTATASSSYDGGTKFEDLEDIMQWMFRFGSTEKMVFAGDVFLMNLQRLIRNAKGIHWDLKSDKEFGMNVTRVTCPFGTFVMKQHPLFTQMAGGTTGTAYYYGVNSWGFVVDMANIQYVYVKDRDTQYQPDLQSNGVDGLKSGYLTECGLEISQADTHGVIKSFVSYTAE